MPYKVQEDGENVNVVNEDGEVKAVHKPPNAMQKAEEQVKLLQALEHGLKEGDVKE